MKSLVKKNDRNLKCRVLKINPQIIDEFTKILCKVSRNYNMLNISKDMFDSKGNITLNLMYTQWRKLFKLVHKNDQIRMTCVNGTYIIKPV